MSEQMSQVRLSKIAEKLLTLMAGVAIRGACFDMFATQGPTIQLSASVHSEQFPVKAQHPEQTESSFEQNPDEQR
jgi:hypothetical protein